MSFVYKGKKIAFFLAIAFLMLFAYPVISFGEQKSVLIPKGETITLDGRWTTKTEWSDSSEIKITNQDLTAYLRAKLNDRFLYLMVNFISDNGLEKSGDLAVVCFDTENNGQGFPDNDDYCFYRVTRAGNLLDGVMQGNGKEWILLQEAKPYDPYGTMEFFEGQIAYSHENNPYDNINNHVSYEFRIPIDTFGLREVMKAYFYVNDGYTNNFVDWPTNSGGMHYISKVMNVIPSLEKWGEVTLQISDKSRIPNPKAQPEEIKVGAAEVKVLSKQIKNLIIMRIRNMDEGTVGIYGLKVFLPDTVLKAFKGPKGWETESLLDNETKILTSTRPIEPNGKGYFLLKVDNVGPVIHWTAYGSEDNKLAEGTTVPILG